MEICYLEAKEEKRGGKKTNGKQTAAVSAGPSGFLPLKDKLSQFLALPVEVIKLWQRPNLSVSLFFRMERVGREGRGQAPLLRDLVQHVPEKMIPFLPAEVPACPALGPSARLGRRMDGNEKAGAQEERRHASLQYHTKPMPRFWRCGSAGWGVGERRLTRSREILTGYEIPIPRSASNYVLNHIQGAVKHTSDPGSSPGAGLCCNCLEGSCQESPRSQVGGRLLGMDEP